MMRLYQMGQCPVCWLVVLVLLILSVWIQGCTTTGRTASTGPVLPPGSSIEPALEPDYHLNRPVEGSLWSTRKGSMFEDTKARYVGDTVIVDIVENSASKMDVNTEATRKTALKVGVPHFNLFGYETNLGGNGNTNLLGTDFSNTFKGEGKSDRSAQVTASIAARITQVLPNGNLSLYGRRAMKVNNEVQYIVVSGIVRPKDISATNRVQSTFLADSRIEYFGRGALADKQTPGWGSRLIDMFWPW
jgi:flagellar L-ring protein precursor FlgH